MKRAFSLIEILIVVVIIGIVAAIGINGFVQIQNDAKLNTLRARLKQLNIAKEQYISENGRMAAEIAWLNAYQTAGSIPVIAGQTDNSDERCYNLLKRYIERPQAYFTDLLPDGCHAITPVPPVGNEITAVHLLYTGKMDDANGNPQNIPNDPNF